MIACGLLLGDARQKSVSRVAALVLSKLQNLNLSGFCFKLAETVWVLLQPFCPIWVPIWLNPTEGIVPAWTGLNWIRPVFKQQFALF